MSAKLSPTMQDLVAYMKVNGGKIARHPGGFWAKEGWQLHSGQSFGTNSVHALVSRGVATYTRHQTSRRGVDFPIEATLREERAAGSA